MANRKKVRFETQLDRRILSKNFVVRYTVEGKPLGVFFAIGRRNANAVKRNRIKRVFRETFRQSVSSKLLSKVSVCLISKKHVKFDDINEELLYEIKTLATKVARIIS